MKLININITKTSNDSKVKARATIDFDTHQLRGFKIFRDEKTGKDFVTAPSYFNGKSWIPLFKTHTKDDWTDLCSQVIDKYNEELIKESLLEDK
ncbi:MAG TPA: hypothetical protein VMR77_04260 [Patescibacteria group bacterium]|nr:hypothetical protein [Patescibacteria group bacterium]